jgi:hypothetical protein
LADTEVYRDGDRARKILKEYKQIQAELPKLYQEWERIEKNSATEDPKFIDKTVDKNKEK